MDEFGKWILSRIGMFFGFLIASYLAGGRRFTIAKKNENLPDGSPMISGSVVFGIIAVILGAIAGFFGGEIAAVFFNIFLSLRIGMSITVLGTAIIVGLEIAVERLQDTFGIENRIKGANYKKSEIIIWNICQVVRFCLIAVVIGWNIIYFYNNPRAFREVFRWFFK
jgi:hypothetical protein